MRALLDAGVELDIFPMYPLDARLWRYSLDLLSEARLPRNRVHHLGFWDSMRGARPWHNARLGAALSDAVAVSTSAARFGVVPLAKTVYVLPKAWAWAADHADRYDHVLAYWGNYSATCAYAFHRLIGRPIPFSIWLHAGADLYRTPVYMRQKLAYADSIITCCEFNRTYLARHYADLSPPIADRVHVCYHGLD